MIEFWLTESVSSLYLIASPSRRTRAMPVEVFPWKPLSSSALKMDHLTNCFTCRLLKTRLPWFPKHIEIAPRQRFFFMSTYMYLQALTQRGERVHVWESKEKGKKKLNKKQIGNKVSSSLSSSGLDQKNKFTAKSRKVTRRYLATSFFLELRRS